MPDRPDSPQPSPMIAGTVPRPLGRGTVPTQSSTQDRGDGHGGVDPRAQRFAGQPSRLARGATCPCGAHVLVGLDADRAALLARVDPQPITPVGELSALLAGRFTYDAIRVGNRLQLSLRRSSHIATPRVTPVLVEHRCGAAPLPAEHWPARERTGTGITTEPEF
jgi:hypothetical protein